MYTATITRSGQVTLPKELRDYLGVKIGGKITFDKGRDVVTIRRKLTDEEFFAELDKNISTKTRKLIKKYAQKTTSELLDDHVRSPEVRKELRDKYGL